MGQVARAPLAGGRVAASSLWLDVPGARLHAWLVAPTTPPPWPAVVMAHGWAAVKEMNLDYVAAAIAWAGIAAIVFDHRGFGASAGLRGDIDPEQQIGDYRCVLRIAAARADVDAARLGVWGTSYSGGHVLCVSARDPSVRAAVAQVPTISGSESTRRRYDAATRERMARRARDELVVAADVGGRPIGEQQSSFEPVAAADLPPAPQGAYDDADRWRFYADLPAERLRTWRNRVTQRSLQRYAAYEPGRSLRQAARKPLLVVYGDADTITPSDLIRDAIGAADQPVETLVVPGGHYGVYAAQRDRAAAAAARFFATHL